MFGVPEISCLVYQRAAVWCIRDQLSVVPEISCLVYHRAAVWGSMDLPWILADPTAHILKEKAGTDSDMVRSILFVTDEGKVFISANKKITPQVENINIHKFI